MAHIRPRYRKKDGKKVLSTYHAEFYDPQRRPSRKYVPLRTKNKSAARSKLSRLEEQYARKEWDPWTDTVPVDGVSFDKAVEMYLAARGDRRARTRRADKSLLNLLGSKLGPGTPLYAVEERHVRLVIRPGLADRTKRTYHARLGAFFTWCVGEGLSDRSPLDGMPKPRVGARQVEFMSREQYASLLDAIEADAAEKESGEVERVSLKTGEVRWLGDVVRVAVGTGLRLGEVCNLRWSAVDLTHRLVTVKNQAGFRSKSGHERTVPVAGDALETLRRLQANRRGKRDGYVFEPTSNRKGTKKKLDERYVSRRFKKYVGEAGLPEAFSFHTLRHTYASWLAMAGVDLYRIQKLLGHASIETTMIYAHLTPDQFTKEVERVFG
jgi:integrase